MSTQDLLAQGTDSLLQEENELREKLMQYRFRLSTGELEDSSVIRKARRRIARIKTIVNARNGDKNAN